MNVSTILLLIVVAALVAVIVRILVRSGGNTCPGCAGSSGCPHCHSGRIAPRSDAPKPPCCAGKPNEKNRKRANCNSCEKH